MNKALKNFVIAACICIAIGIVFLLGGIAFGGVDLAKGIVVKQLGYFNLPFEFKINSDGETGFFVSGDMEDWDEIMELDDFDEAETYHFSVNELKNLDVDFDAGLLRIDESSEKDIEVQCKGKIEVKLEGDSLKITSDVQPFFFNKKNIVKILIPQDMKWTMADIDADAGKIELNNMECEKLNFDLSAGQVLVKQLNTNLANVDMDAGEIRMEQSNVNDLHTNVDMGSFIYKGSLVHDCSINVNAGNAVLQLNGEEEDYNYDIKVDLGSITIDNNTFSGSSKSENKNNGADSNMDLNCNLGAIEVYFK